MERRTRVARIFVTVLVPRDEIVIVEGCAYCRHIIWVDKKRGDGGEKGDTFGATRAYCKTRSAYQAQSNLGNIYYIG